MGAEPQRETERLDEEVKRRRLRREQWEREGHRSAAEYLAIAGAIGWSIVLPALLGVLVGRRLDLWLDTGVTFTAALVFVGVGLGSWMAWRQVEER